ncbi:hypothetical protein C0V80_03930 [Leuconostoc pseudomesenteroides]|nr:hypothetical protein [Leuconostoc pseudomesenteroides]
MPVILQVTYMPEISYLGTDVMALKLFNDILTSDGVWPNGNSCTVNAGLLFDDKPYSLNIGNILKLYKILYFELISLLKISTTTIVFQ